MENKIDIAAILKDCPRGMELDCALCDNCTFDGIEDVGYNFILVNTPSGRIRLSKEGCYIRHDENAKCVIFPKGKTTWEGFHRPFKDGDIISDGFFDTICIFKGEGRIKGTVDFYCGISSTDELFIKDVKDQDEHFGEIYEYKFATEEEKEKLFQAIKDNGYQWNAETKTLEKLIKPKFKIGDKIVNDDYIVEIIDMDIEGEVYGYKSKVGATGGILFTEQDNWELVPDKFDVTTLKPYDRVLARCSSLEKWRIQLFEKFDKTCKFPFICMGYNKYKQCIPYEGNEHLLDTADSCSDYYQL